jgi:phosphate/sulfate permease
VTGEERWVADLTYWLLTWVMTIPLSGAFSALVYILLRLLSHVHVSVTMIP